VGITASAVRLFVCLDDSSTQQLNNSLLVGKTRFLGDSCVQ